MEEHTSLHVTLQQQCDDAFEILAITPVAATAGNSAQPACRLRCPCGTGWNVLSIMPGLPVRCVTWQAFATTRAGTRTIPASGCDCNPADDQPGCCTRWGRRCCRKRHPAGGRLLADAARSAQREKGGEDSKVLSVDLVWNLPAAAGSCGWKTPRKKKEKKWTKVPRKLLEHMKRGSGGSLSGKSVSRAGTLAVGCAGSSPSASGKHADCSPLACRPVGTGACAVFSGHDYQPEKIANRRGRCPQPAAS